MTKAGKKILEGDIVSFEDSVRRIEHRRTRKCEALVACVLASASAKQMRAVNRLLALQLGEWEGA